ncbi:DUF4931 domain-containing protein [Bacillus sp. WMMC1349]|uniref:DUF4931 domain-containing protein n=1 Tax=Bacillus sp. WMMC1349 TaxID=2736254 RepID=UPI0015558617|nr:DUF4931 domain-containing protein [Bacillus sp. WMMC1349]NPC90748.1 DUF4931 domain-containing protein [Bacillus sp. WMMC1349]NPC91638.1 DUF4931 domain-containing protein [Bacillus sp. WMMC1349]
MNMHKLYFSSDIGEKKPETIINRQSACPFCERDQLTGILETDEEMIWLENKYPTIQNTYQTLIIETDHCNEDIAVYRKAKMRKLIRFSLEKWLNMEAQDCYKSVILYKNYGPFSGGSIKHAHMQIVGLKQVDYMKELLPEHFQGIKVIEKPSEIELNLSTNPIIGFTEFNIIISDTLEHTDKLADYIQKTVQYVLHDFNQKCSSYNMFFYHTNLKIICKIVPRFIASPFFIGYKIPQVSVDQRLNEIRTQLVKKINETK